MSMKYWFWSGAIGIAVAAFVLGGCGKKKDQAGEEKSRDEKAEKRSEEKKDEKKGKTRTGPGKAEPARPRPPQKAEPARPVEVMKIDNPGPAYFGVDGTGLVRLQGGKFTVLGGVGRSVRDVGVAPDGTVWAISLGRVYRVSGDKAVKVGDYRSVGSPNRLAVGPRGDVWTIGFKGVGHYDGKSWTIEPKSKLGKVTLLKDVAVDKSGQVWVTSSYGVHARKSDGTWVTHDTARVAGARAFFDKIAVGPKGVVHVAFLRGVVRFQNGAWSKPFSLRRRVAHIAACPDGRVFAVTGMAKVHEFSAEGGTERQITAASGGFKAGYVRALAADGAGRLWMATDHGIVILQPKGGTVQWEPGTVRDVSGRVSALAVAGNGPNLPAVGPKIAGSVKGKVLRAGAGVANAEIEICESPSMLFRKSPCAEAPFRLASRTGGQGDFMFKDVPLGTYRFAIKVGGKWRITLGSDCCTGMKQGQVFDVGSIRLRVDRK